MVNMDSDSYTLLGGFTVGDDEEVVVGDPCYEDTLWSTELTDVSRGYWTAYVRKDRKTNRVSELLAVCHGWPFPELEDFGYEGHTAGVDSGQLGIYSKDMYRTGDYLPEDLENRLDLDLSDPAERFYAANCDRSLSKKQAGVLPRGVVSASGYGDGEYPVRLVRDTEGTVMAIWVVFYDLGHPGAED